MLDALDQTLQPLDQRHRAADRFGGGDQDAVAAIGKFKPGAAAGDEHAERRSRSRAAAPAGSRRSAAIFPRAVPPGAGVRPPGRRVFWARAAPLAAPNSLAPTGLAQRIRVPSTDQSQAGRALVAWTASRGSPTPRNWNSALFIATT